MSMFWIIQRVSFIDPFQSLARIKMILFISFFLLHFYVIFQSYAVSKYKIIEMELEKKISVTIIENVYFFNLLYTLKKLMKNFIFTQNRSQYAREE